MRALVVGLNWGHVHINALRELGHDIAGVVDVNADKARDAALQYNLQHYYSSLQDIDTFDFDLVTLAVPACSHYTVLQESLRFNVPVICEKPVLGMTGTVEQYRNLNDRLFFNYAYPFLNDADIFYSKLNEIEECKEISITCLYNIRLSKSFTQEEMFFETVSHPLALLIHKLSDRFEPEIIRRADIDCIEVFAANCPIIRIINRFDPNINGISHHIKVSGRDTLELKGEYISGKLWHYKPVIFNNDYISIEHFPQTCPWYSANKRSLSNLTDYFEGRINLDTALERGAFNLKKALIVEKILSCLK